MSNVRLVIFMKYWSQSWQTMENILLGTTNPMSRYLSIGFDSKQVLVPLDESLLGTFVSVRIVSTGKFFMLGEVINAPNSPSPPPMCGALSKTRLPSWSEFSVVVVVVSCLWLSTRHFWKR